MEFTTTLITGGTSMVGQAIAEAAKNSKSEVLPLTHEQCDLLKPGEFYKVLLATRPNYIVHAAGWNGGIEWNKQYPADIYYRTAQMALNVYNEIAEYNKRNRSIQKVMGILASCSYPDHKDDYFKEPNLWMGRPNYTVECHGLAKRVIADFSRQIYKQYDLKCMSCILNNCYGPHDSYHPEKTKVVGAMVKRFVDAKQQDLDSVTCWGTGSPLREFVFAPDAGRAIVECLQKYDDCELPINISSGQEISILDLTCLVADIVGYEGAIIWDTHKPDGQLRKSLDIARFREISDMEFTPMREGLIQTIEWYKNNGENI
jgi:GDP-L-fucose synthase